MARLTREQTQKLIEMYGVDRLWSYSRFNSYLEDPWRYAMLYIKKVKNEQNVYSHWGTVSHDLVQGYYDGEHSYEDMIRIFDEKVMEYNLDPDALKFPSEKVRDGYFKNLRVYFQNTEIIPHKVKNEQAVLIPLYDKKREEDVVFVGYIDSMYVDEDGVTNIIDFKTSSKGSFTGRKLVDTARQLKLYCIGIHKTQGIPYENIRMRFDLMKYYDVQYKQKNGKIGSSKQERASWVSTQLSKLRKDLFELGYDPFEVDAILEESVENNSIKNLPQEVQDKFNLANCWVDITIDSEEADELEELVCDVVAEIKEKEALAIKEGFDVAFPEPEINASNRFFYENLAPNLLKHHEGYKNEQAILNAREGNSVTDDFLLNMFEEAGIKID